MQTLTETVFWGPKLKKYDLNTMNSKIARMIGEIVLKVWKIPIRNEILWYKYFSSYIWNFRLLLSRGGSGHWYVAIILLRACIGARGHQLKNLDNLQRTIIFEWSPAILIHEWLCVWATVYAFWLCFLVMYMLFGIQGALSHIPPSWWAAYAGNNTLHINLCACRSTSVWNSTTPRSIL